MGGIIKRHESTLALWCRLKALLHSPNSKIDGKALVDIDDAGSRQEHIAPASETELYLATMWQEALKLEEVGVQIFF